MIYANPYADFLGIFRSCDDGNLPISQPKIDESGKLIGFRIDSGFSKSGSAVLVYKNDTIEVHTRYNTVNLINTFEDLVGIAWCWYFDYKDRGYLVPSEFADIFVAGGYLRKVVIESYEEV